MPVTKPIYLDHQATTPLDPDVLTAMWPYFIEKAGNPSSQGHLYGWEAAAAVKKARETIASAINASPESIIFTSGATEANNLVIKGIAEAYFAKGRHLVTVQTEHAAVLAPCRYLEQHGFEITYLPVQADGLVDLDQLTPALREDTILVSVMAANNEIGVLQPIEKISALCQSRGILCHTDAAQALGKIPLDVQALGVDFMSLTAHKLYGPKGIGGLYRKPQTPPLKLIPQLHGGGQEQNLRSGTLPTPQIVGFAQAVTLAHQSLDTESVRLAGLREKLWQGLEKMGDVIRNGHRTETLPGCLNVSFWGLDGAQLQTAIQGKIALSSGSACSSAKPEPSHVLVALGRTLAECRATLRFGLGRSTTEAEIEQTLEILIKAIQRIRG
ncbi:cysteine desulfurase family protein [Thermosynechococcaceae cyanobacterium BACA0444]|uniref:cysteine desulfurase n=1 Tax=Pseudocalidococcus azoricus BACA0444 TaxID=2918990 RepID=A0AAE4FPZ8_9CYAN|nr:cysteine desulfurase family protein [Pseudocalidococcus azoricus]MDS3860119.1 cysteine desulfurase family protein [Pseudocalidococcus azoricus BACA0444]